MADPTNDSSSILVVDDDSLVREVVLDTLRDCGYRLLEAADGAEAIRIMEQEKPSLILLDLLMPKKSGLEVLAEAPTRSPGSRVIVLTSMDSDGMIDLAIRAGATRFIAKPFHPMEITESVRALISP